ncbi:hypothetical protein CT157_06795 [Pseudomonas syringae]|uniref:Uncharacterized protein n=1 Tax=Pseudomonas syringae TaxID=317 RepID=A0A3T0JQH8_PSESX|nr:hypothetical protein CT157_06795 [Pseudomonas syringae]
MQQSRSTLDQQHGPQIVPTLCVGMHTVTLRVTVDAERPWRHSHAERGNDHYSTRERSVFFQ